VIILSQKYPLNETLSPIHRDGRNRINENWTRIMAYFDYVQSQIKVLAGGHEVDELITRLEQAIDAAEIDVQKYITQVDTTVQQAIDANNTATQDAIAALQTALQTVSSKLDELNTAISNAETATADATNAKNAAIQATQDAQDAINTMQSLIDNFGHRGAWSSTTQYYKNNLVGLDGRTYIALQENVDTPVTNQSVWALFADKGAQGPEGPRGLPGKDGKDGTGVNIISELLSESDLPSTGLPGDAYMIDGNLYVWQDNSGTWKNVGPIQGPEGKSAYDLAVANGFEGTMEEWIESLKGIQGPPGPEGPPGPPADLTEINQKVDGMKTEVTEHLAEKVLSEQGAHGIRYFDGKLAVKNDAGQWDIVETGSSGDVKEYVGDINNLTEYGKYYVPASGSTNIPVAGNDMNIEVFGSTDKLNIIQVAYFPKLVSESAILKREGKRPDLNSPVVWNVVTSEPKIGGWHKVTMALSNSLNDTSTSSAATPNVVKVVNDTVTAMNTRLTKVEYSIYDSEHNATLLNGWSGVARYYKDRDGTIFVYINVSFGTKTKGTGLFTLPSGYRARWGFLSYAGLTHNLQDDSGVGMVLEISNDTISLGKTARDYVVASFTLQALQ
jgi:hypothetical protein